MQPSGADGPRKSTQQAAVESWRPVGAMQTPTFREPNHHEVHWLRSVRFVHVVLTDGKSELSRTWALAHVFAQVPPTSYSSHLVVEDSLPASLSWAADAEQ